MGWLLGDRAQAAELEDGVGNGVVPCDRQLEEIADDQKRAVERGKKMGEERRGKDREEKRREEKRRGKERRGKERRGEESMGGPLEGEKVEDGVVGGPLAGRVHPLSPCPQLYLHVKRGGEEKGGKEKRG